MKLGPETGRSPDGGADIGGDLWLEESKMEHDTGH